MLRFCLRVESLASVTNAVFLEASDGSVCVQVIIWTRCTTSRWRIRRNIPQTERHLLLGLFPARDPLPRAAVLGGVSALERGAAAALVSGALAGERAASERLLRLRAAPLPGARGPRAALQESEESGADQSCLAAVLERLHHALLRRPVALHAAPALLFLLMVIFFLGQLRVTGGVEMMELACHRRWSGVQGKTL